MNRGLFITGASWKHSQVALLKASHNSDLDARPVFPVRLLKREINKNTCFLPCHRDNYGFVTYYNTKDAFTAIENGSKLRKSDELPFDLCFGGRRQFCQTSYADLGTKQTLFFLFLICLNKAKGVEYHFFQHHVYTGRALGHVLGHVIYIDFMIVEV